MKGGRLAELMREVPGLKSGDLAALSDAEVATLLDAVKAAKRRQREALKAAIDKGMGFVPALLRIPLKRILFP